MTTGIVWQTFPLAPAELSLARVLRCGQTFRWKNVNSVWSFSTADRIILLKQDHTHLHYASVKAEHNGSGKDQTKQSPQQEADATLAFIKDYFNLHVSLTHLYQGWAKVETAARGKSTSFAQFPGIRILRQDPWETVVLFICSSNNNVKRISKMCDALCTEYGRYVGNHDDVDYYSFPQPADLAGPEVETRLRELGFGYRAKYIAATAQMFVSNDKPHISLEKLDALRHEPFEEAHAFLLQLTGVGPKVADCICLMALDKHDVVPVDTHVLQIAVRDYKYRGPRTMNKKTYEMVRRHLADLFGEYAGWAQLVMFAADLADLNNGVNQIAGTDVRHTVEEKQVKAEAIVLVKTETDNVVKAEAVSLVKTEIKLYQTEAKIKRELKDASPRSEGIKRVRQSAVKVELG